MRKYVCSVCGYVYDEAKGIPDANIVPGTKWEDLPEDWVCPLCGAMKTEFREQQSAAKPATKEPLPARESPDHVRGLSGLQMSALCSNLAKGCEKQYKLEEAALFTELANYFKLRTAPVTGTGFDALLLLAEKDLDAGFPGAKAVSTDAADRGALRALVWSEKVTRILKSLLSRYEKEGDVMLENADIFVCTICGFIFVGDMPPEICPVCKVPNWKFEKVEGR